MSLGFRGTALIDVLSAPVGCGASDKVQTESSESFGAAWPFMVDSVDLMCDGPSPKALARTAGGDRLCAKWKSPNASEKPRLVRRQDITSSTPTMPAIKMD